jgi:hypothetical protein
MLGKDPVTLTEAYPKAVLHAKRLRAALTGKIHFFNGQKNRSRVFHASTRSFHSTITSRREPFLA